MKTKHYPVFETNQILTSTHLNQLREYLDEENRITRTKLSGFGIVCGLEMKFESPSREIIINKGYGISSDGYLIELENNSNYTHYKVYTYQGETPYPPWIKDKKQIEILEIFNKDVEESKKLSTVAPGDFIDKVAVLYLELEDENLQTCMAKGCDHKGKKRVFKIRVLLIKKEDLDAISLENIITRDEDLKEINIDRLYGDSLKDVGNYNKIRDGYKLIVNKYKKIIANEITAAHTKYAGFLGLKDIELPKNDDLKNKDFKSKTFQYAYDFLKDLILAYDEFRGLALEIEKECYYDIPKFPQHLMLGLVNHGKIPETESDEYRNYFINAPLSCCLDEKILKSQWLFQRILVMIQSFIDGDTLVNNHDIKITPSREEPFPLGERSIPYYYDIDTYPDLVRLWNPDLTFKNKEDSCLSYSEDQLQYSIDTYPFFRIEGHLEKNYQEVKSSLLTKKNDYNLPFEIIALQISQQATGSIEIKDNCGWRDLQTEYISARNSLLCLIQNLILSLENLKNCTKINIYKIIDFETLKQQFLNVQNLLSECLDAEFNFIEFYDTYKILIQILIEGKLKLKDRFGKLIHEEIDSLPPEEFQDKKIILENGIKVFKQFIDNCIYVKILTVFYTYEWRISYLKENHLSIFNNFIKKYPGMEHQAGVSKGGTFIIVYKENTGIINKKVVADFTLPCSCCCENCEVPACNDGQGSEGLVFPPIARDDYAEMTTEETNVKIYFMKNDYLIDGGEIIYESHETQSANGGTVTYNQNKKSFTYKPPSNANFTGIDKFDYKIRKRNTDFIEKATVTILVRNKYSKHILAVNDLAFTDTQKPVLIDVLANDIVNDNTSLVDNFPFNSILGATIEVVEKKIKYTPGGYGTDKFVYEIKDAGRNNLTSKAEVTVIVYCCERDTGCELPDIEETVYLRKQITIDFENRISNDVIITGIGEITRGIAEVIWDKKHISILPLAALWQQPKYTFKYFGENVITGDKCEATITIIPFKPVTTVTGTIITNTDPLPGVNVMVTGTNMGATTNRDGQYRISNLPPNATTLVFSLVGYNQVVEEINNRSVINVNLVST